MPKFGSFLNGTVLLPETSRAILLGTLVIIVLLSSFTAASSPSSSSSSSAASEYHRYIIVGSGPGGLQLGHYLDTAERDYLIVEKVRNNLILIYILVYLIIPLLLNRRILRIS